MATELFVLTFELLLRAMELLPVTALFVPTTKLLLPSIIFDCPIETDDVAEETVPDPTTKL